MSRVKGSFKVLLLLAFAVILTGCSLGPISLDVEKWFHTTSVQEAIKNKRDTRQQIISNSALHTPGVLTVGLRTQSVTAPMIVASEGGTLQGVDVEIASALADQLGVDVKFVTVNGSVDGLQSDCDIVMDVRSDEDATSRLVSTYAESSTALFYRGHQQEIKSADLGGKTVGVQAGSLSQRALGQVITGMNIQEFSNVNDAFEALKNGSIDFVACDAYAGTYLTSNQDISMAGIIDTPTPIGIAISSNNSELISAVQQALSAIHGNGIEEVIRSKWVGTLPHLSSDNKISDLLDAPVQTNDAEASSTESSSSSAQ